MICFRDLRWFVRAEASVVGLVSTWNLTDWLILKRGLWLTGFRSLVAVVLGCVDCSLVWWVCGLVWWSVGFGGTCLVVFVVLGCWRDYVCLAFVLGFWLISRRVACLMVWVALRVGVGLFLLEVFCWVGFDGLENCTYGFLLVCSCELCVWVPV